MIFGKHVKKTKEANVGVQNVLRVMWSRVVDRIVRSFGVERGP